VKWVLSILAWLVTTAALAPFCFFSVYESVGDERPARLLEPGLYFEVVLGSVRITVPGAVQVLERTPNYSFGKVDLYFDRGDTLFVFDYLGEGFFNGLHKGQPVEVEIFWPWSEWIPGEDYHYSGRVLQEWQGAFWISAALDDDQIGWINVDASNLAAAYSLVDEPLKCRTSPP